MRRVAPWRRGTRVVAAVGLVLVLHVAAPARADAPDPPAQTSTALLPLPPPGTQRLVRLGPEALVMEDDQGRVTAVDELAAEPRRAETLIAATTMLAILGAGAFFFIGPRDITDRSVIR